MNLILEKLESAESCIFISNFWRKMQHFYEHETWICINWKYNFLKILEDERVTTEKCRLFHVYRNVAYLFTHEDKKQDISLSFS